eukprot:maker-scaffold716_size107355-snap-gene-0.23 protein:Tk05810 transcript:maker-scaffold716_size107355-snap-gene-0.23-mRNA-1 annotation:"conserved hypothetical protein"
MTLGKSQNGSLANQQDSHLKRRHEVPYYLQFNKYVLNSYRPVSDSRSCISLANQQDSHLKRRHEVPYYLQFNKYVLNSYRPVSDSRSCIRSLTLIHNESVNIWTHALPPLVILYYLSTMLPWDQLKPIPMWFPYLHVICCIAPWLGSTMYHLFMNHQSGVMTYKKLLTLDMICIWIAQNLGSVPCVWVTSICFSPSLKYASISAFSLGSIVSLYQAVTAVSPLRRRYSFAIPFAMRICAIAVRVLGSGGGSSHAIFYLIMQDFFAVIGGAIGAFNIPERWFPGRFDLCLNSHNIMHVLVVLAAYMMHHAVILDFLWLSSFVEGVESC